MKSGNPENIKYTKIFCHAEQQEKLIWISKTPKLSQYSFNFYFHLFKMKVERATSFVKKPQSNNIKKIVNLFSFFVGQNIHFIFDYVKVSMAKKILLQLSLCILYIF